MRLPAAPYGDTSYVSFAQSRFVLNRGVAGGTLRQNGQILNWNTHGYYEIALDAGSLTLSLQGYVIRIIGKI